MIYAIELARLVAEMRKAQRAYFLHRRPSDLTESKRLERRVDCALDEILGGKEQPSLFDLEWEDE